MSLPAKPPLQHDVYLAAESLHSKSKLCTEMSTMFGRGNVFHVELVIKVPCKGIKNKCKYCEQAKRFPKEHVNKRYGHAHYLSYSVYGGEGPYENVYCAVDFDYQRIQPSAWAFLSLPMNPKHKETLHTFLDHCVGQGFNHSFRYRFLFMKMLGCLPLDRFGCFGFRSVRDNHGSYQPVGAPSWFCSELCICALQECGWLIDLDPRITPPNVLFNTLLRDDRTELFRDLPVAAKRNALLAKPPKSKKTVTTTATVEMVVNL